MTLEERISRMIWLLESISFQLIDFEDKELARQILEVYIHRWRKATS